MLAQPFRVLKSRFGGQEKQTTHFGIEIRAGQPQFPALVLMSETLSVPELN